MRRDERSVKLLLVEDNPGDALLVEEYLEEHLLRHEIVLAEKFHEFQSILQNNNKPFDVILVDLSLPDISKEDLIENINVIAKSSPVIILTGYSDLDFATKSLAAGVSDYLVKDTINALVLYKSILYSIERHRFVQSLRESEKRYMDIFHLSPAPMWVYDIGTLKFLDVNEATVKHYGYSRDEFLSMTLKEIRPEQEIPNLMKAIKSIRNDSVRKKRNFFKHQKKDGTIIFMEISTSEIIFKGKNSQIVLASDVTEKVKQLEAIEVQNERLKEIAWMQSHVVRAPVSRMMGIIDLMKTGTLSIEEKEEMLGYILSSAEELDGIIREISEKSQTVFTAREKSRKS